MRIQVSPAPTPPTAQEQSSSVLVLNFNNILYSSMETGAAKMGRLRNTFFTNRPSFESTIPLITLNLMLIHCTVQDKCC